jgi:lipopolysaccharide export system protein LptC
MQSRLYDRIAAALSLVLLVALGLFSFYLSQVAEREQASRSAPRPASTEPDYFVERLALLTMDERGQPAYRLEAKQLQHFSQDDTTVFESPVMVSLDPARPRVTVTARRGRMLDGGEEAHLQGDVQVTRAGTANAAPLLAETEFAVVLPSQDIVRTDRPVTVVQGPNRLSGVGMELNNRTRQLRLDSRVSTVWQPPPESAGAEPGQPAVAR